MRVINGGADRLRKYARPRNPLREIAAPIDKLYGPGDRQLGVQGTKVLSPTTRKMYSTQILGVLEGVSI